MTDDRPPPIRPVSGDPSGGAGLTPEDLVFATGGALLRRGGRLTRGAAVDSRLVRPDELFVALRGERTDGHRFLAAAAAAGAAALLVEQLPPDVTPESLGDVTVLQVPDALRGLQAIAAAWRGRFDPLVVGVTGSIAKTSTKEAIAAVLTADRATLKSEGNQNNEIGLPLTVLRLGPEHAAVVLEMGMYVGGEIRELAAIGRPQIGVVTRVLGVHLSRIGSLDAIEAAKGELVEALPADGVAVLNADDPRVRRMAGRTAARAVTYGFAGGADVTADGIRSGGLDGMAFTLRAGARVAPDGQPVALPATIPGLGPLSVHNALAAAAVGMAAGVPVERILAGLRNGWSAPHRGEVHRVAGVTIVDDAYNSAPASVAAALEVLAAIPGRHVAVLGEMLELGDETDAGHRDTGSAAARACDMLVTVGPGAARIAEGARDAGMPAAQVIETPDREAAAARLADMLATGDVVLVKASRGVGLEVLVEALVERLEGRRG
ncbi:MAG: UDP-N-acetylmuramoyl-tripeptide--D-alanyl-D-alanine ligase [Chloroflexi bacterium]|nr:UDP-N-acetylmuramoyl-tripeptide--D-alanyl-D-alanine ligase [Chloroflexota bacterium]